MMVAVHGTAVNLKRHVGSTLLFGSASTQKLVTVLLWSEPRGIQEVLLCFRSYRRAYTSMIVMCSKSLEP